MSQKYTYEQLIEKFVRAKMSIELIPIVPHTSLCPADDDTGYGACTCGADKTNKSRDTALEQLKL